MSISLHKLFDISRNYEPTVLKATRDLQFVFVSIVYRKSRPEPAVYSFTYSHHKTYKKTCFQEESTNTVQ
jgi:hypothetical protein